MRFTLKYLVAFCFIAQFNFVKGQDLLDEIEPDKPEVERVIASFKNSKVINAQSLETTDKGVLDFRISHRPVYV
jgi:hypothetical protein